MSASTPNPTQSSNSRFQSNRAEEADSKTRTFCRVCKKEFFGLDPEISRKQAQANAFTHWLRHCRMTFTSELKCENGVVWVEVNAAKRLEQDRLNDAGPPRWTCPAKICDRKYQTPRSFHEHWNRIHTGIDPTLIEGIVDMPVHKGLNDAPNDGIGSSNSNPNVQLNPSRAVGPPKTSSNNDKASPSKKEIPVRPAKKRTVVARESDPNEEDDVDILGFEGE